MKNIIICASGLMGKLVLEKLSSSKFTPFILTLNNSIIRNKQIVDFHTFHKRYQIFESSGEYYEDSKHILPDADAFICIDWKKDYFINERQKCPVYYCHPSLLPMYRGYNAVSSQIASGVIYSGLTVYKEENNTYIDSGNIVFQEQIKIEYHHKPIDFIENCALAVIKFINMIYSSTPLTNIIQNEDKAFYLSKPRKNKLIVDFNMSAYALYNFMRAYMYPFNYTFMIYKGEKYRITDASIESWSGKDANAGQVIKKDAEGITVACGEGSILIKEVLYCDKIMKADMIPLYPDDIIE